MSSDSEGTALGRRVRATALALLLAGSVFPNVGGVPIHVAASVLALPLIAWEALRPSRKPVLAVAFLLVGPLFLANWFFLPEVSTAYGHDKVRALFSSTLISALGASLLRDRASVLTFAKVWAATGFLLAAVTIVSGGGVGARATTFDSNPIWLARTMASAAVALVWLGWHGHCRRLFFLPGVSALVVAVVLTGSRGPALGLLAGVAVVAGLATSGRTRRLMSGFASLVIALFVASLVPALRNNRVFAFLDQTSASGDVDLGERAEMWTRSWALILREPAGVGFGNWAATAPTPTLHEYPHNLFLEVVAEAGWIPGTIFVGTVVVVIWRLARSSRGSSIASLALGLLVAETASVAVSGDINARTFFAMVTLGWAISSWEQEPRHAGG